MVVWSNGSMYCKLLHWITFENHSWQTDRICGTMARILSIARIMSTAGNLETAYRRVPFVCPQMWYYGFLFSSISAKVWSFLHISRVAVKRNSTFFENCQLWDTWDIMILIDLVTDLWLSSYSSSKSPILERKQWFWQRSKFPTWKRGESFPWFSVYCDSTGSRVPILPGTDSTGFYRVLLLYTTVRL